MESKENSWKLGEIVNLPRSEKLLKKSGSATYQRYIASRYICIREEANEQHGILLKVLGKAYSDQVAMVGGEPFSKDSQVELFDSYSYFSYPFPSSSEVKEVLGILRSNHGLLQKFEDAKMHINPESMYWVNETARKAIVKKIPQVYSSQDDQIHTATEDTAYYRISIVYFYNGKLTW